MPEYATNWIDLPKYSWCEIPRFHRYACFPKRLFNPELYKVNSTVEIEGGTYQICKILELTPDKVTWFLVYAHYCGDPMSEKEWNELYGPSVAD